jgi:hypothetical protein
MSFQNRQIVRNRVPDSHEINGAIAVNRRVAQPVGEVEPQLRVVLGKSAIRRLNLLAASPMISKFRITASRHESREV